MPRVTVKHYRGTKSPFFIMKEELYKFSGNTIYESIKYKSHLPIDVLQSAEESMKLDVNKKKLYFLKESQFHDEKTFVENYGNPLYTVKSKSILVVVEKYDDKVSIKLFTTERQRLRGNHFFKVTKIVNYLTVNLKTGDFYLGLIMNYHKKRKKSKNFSKNTLSYNLLNNFGVLIRNNLSTFCFKQGAISDNSIYVVPSRVIEILSSFIKVDEKVESYQTDNRNKLLQFYLEKKKIKYPNNYHLYFRDMGSYLRLKNLNKFNRNVIDAFMDHHELKGKKIKKALHICSDLNVKLLKFLINIFGQDRINKDEFLILNALNFKFNYYHFLDLRFFRSDDCSSAEMNRIYELFRDSILYDRIELNTLSDHLFYYTELKNYGETDLKWMSYNKSTFNKEHTEWVDKFEFYRKGSYIRIYPIRFQEISEEKFVVNDKTYYPVLLKTSTDFNLESSTQSNCVKGYIGKPSSIIFSIRVGSIDSEERATVEYLIRKNDSEGIHKIRSQSLGRFNSKLTEEWEKPLNILDRRVEYYIKSKIFEPVKIEKECSNGVKLHSDSDWEGGRLKWTYKPIEKDLYYYD